MSAGKHLPQNTVVYLWHHAPIDKNILRTLNPACLTLIRILFAVGFLITLNPVSSGQGEFGVIAGISNYQGDLSSYSTADGFQALIGPVIGAHVGIEKSDAFAFKADLLYTRLAGDDALNEKEETRQRNLDFFSPVVQLAVGLDWHLLGFSQQGATDFSPYLSVGASAFYFSPKTKYEGKTVALRPLGTEGQYLDDYPDQKPYSPIQPTLQFGGGLKFFTSNEIIIALETTMSLTFTDYLDDVSTIYISYPELLANAGPLTAALANRTGEYYGTEPVIVPTGTSRANSQSKDFFGTITVRVSKPFAISSKQFKVRSHNKKRIHCPKF
jgi:hypothetical protein